MPLLFSLPRFEGMTRWIAGRRRSRLVPLLLLAFAAAAPGTAAQQPQLPVISVNSPSIEHCQQSLSLYNRIPCLLHSRFGSGTVDVDVVEPWRVHGSNVKLYGWAESMRSGWTS